MQKIILLIILIFPAFYIYSQSPDAERRSIDSLFKGGKLNTDQVALLRKKWNAVITKYRYPELKVNTSTGEIDISEILTFSNFDKKILFQRSLQWIAINYGDLTHNDLESGKIIANGLIDLTHFAEYQVGFGSREIRQIQTPTNYTLILTIKDNKIKYNITNITYTFTNFSETITEISFPIISLFPIVAQDQMQWVKFITVLNATTDKFYFKLKNSLVDYINDADNDYKF
jgi:hypothetical protein